MEKLFEQVITEAISQGVTDLHFKSFHDPIIEKRYRGKLTPYLKMPVQTYQKFFSYLQYKANIDMNHHQQPQTGAFQWFLENKTYYFRLSYLPSPKDIHLVLRILNHKQQIKLDNLCDDPIVLQKFRKLLNKQNGMIVVSGPTGSGKSTTLHAFLEELAKSNEKSLITLEDPIEIYHSQMVQIQIDETQGMSFQDALIQILRHDPDVVMIGEIRDEISAAIAMRLALTGHLILTTLHAADVKSTLTRLENLGLIKDDLEDVLRAVISQRLVYSEKAIQPLCFFEIATGRDLKKLMRTKEINYATMDEVLLKAVEEAKVDYEEIEYLLND